MSRSTTESRVLSRRYRVEEYLGQGGMARVHRGTDLVLDRTVAVKILAGHMARDGRSVRRFRREAQAAAGLNHPGIVGVYDTGSDDGIHYIVMEYVIGSTLADNLEERGALPPGEAARIASAVATALGHAHRKGIVHRDIKPANVMITPSGEVKVMDFGIARAIDSDTYTHTAAIIGTATYFAPEQARGEPVDSRSDIYALGVVLYEMLTGRPPFVADSPVAVASMHLREEPRPPSQLNGAIGLGLEAVVLRAMAKDRAERHQSAEQLRDELDRFASLDGPLAPSRSLAGVSSTAAARTETIASDRTALLPTADPAAPADPGRRGPRRARWALWLVPIAAVLALGLVTSLVLVGLARDPVGQGGVAPSSPRAPASSPSPSPRAVTSSPSPERQAPTSIQEALTRLEVILNQGISSGDLSREAANLIAGDIQSALRSFQDGHLDRSIEKLDKTKERVEKLKSRGDISTSAATELDQAISDLQATMEAASRASSDEEGGD